MLGKCHQKLKDNASAAKYLQMVVDRDAKHSEDQEVGTASCHPGGGGATVEGLGHVDGLTKAESAVGRDYYSGNYHFRPIGQCRAL